MKTTTLANAILAALVAVIVAAPASAAVPEAVTYAGSLRQGSQPADGTFSAFFRIFNAAQGGTQVFEQSEPTLPVSGGELVVDLGTDPSNTLSQELLASGNLFLEITLNGETLEPRVPFTSVPFARRAELAESAEVADQCNDSDLLNGQTDAQLLARVTAGKGLQKSGANGEGLAVAASGITALELAPGAVDSSKIVDGSITNVDIQNETLTGFDIHDHTVLGVDIGINTVTNDNMANDAITSTEILDGSVQGRDIANNTITAQNAHNGVNVIQAPQGCGGQLMPVTGAPSSCHTQVCRVDLGISSFASCDGSCSQNLHNVPVQCTISRTSVGTLLK